VGKAANEINEGKWIVEAICHKNNKEEIDGQFKN
jgi:hypothetical protein